MSGKKEYVGPYKVVRCYRKSLRRKVIRRNLTFDEARSLVRSYPHSNTSIVVFFKQCWADKYFIESKEE